MSCFVGTHYVFLLPSGLRNFLLYVFLVGGPTKPQTHFVLIMIVWFEAFPIVFVKIHHFNLGVSGLPYLGLIVGAAVTYAAYASIFYFILEPKMAREGPPPPENFLSLALATSWFIPASLFIFGE